MALLWHFMSPNNSRHFLRFLNRELLLWHATFIPVPAGPNPLDAPERLGVEPRQFVTC